MDDLRMNDLLLIDTFALITIGTGVLITYFFLKKNL